jgi:hypothetical protein
VALGNGGLITANLVMAELPVVGEVALAGRLSLPSLDAIP